MHCPFTKCGCYPGQMQVEVLGSAMDPFLQSHLPVEALNCAGGVQSGLVGAASCLRWMERTEAESRQKINILKVICLISIEHINLYFIYLLAEEEGTEEGRC